MLRVRISRASRSDYGKRISPDPFKPEMLFGCLFDFTKLGHLSSPYLCVKKRSETERARSCWQDHASFDLKGVYPNVSFQSNT